MTRCRDCGLPVEASGALAGRCLRCLLELALDGERTQSVSSDTDTASNPDSENGFRPELLLGGRYRLLRLLGRGGQGQVWHALDLKLRVEVALKALRPDLTRDQRASELLRREVRSARQVVSPNVCRVFDLVVEDGHEMVSMEFVDGTTLAELLEAKSPLDAGQAGEIAAQLLAGLEAIHAAGLVHRDVKPENIMLTCSRRVVVMDFGVARSLSEGQAGTVMGTLGYMSPEQSAGLPLDARADVFAAAVVLTEMTWPEPMTLDTRKRVWAALREDPPHVPAGPWNHVLRRALARDVESRYPSAGALARALELEPHARGRAEESPYPGLLPFREEDTQFFFGRELEVESLLRQLRRPRLRAVIGPSGAGKSSFLRAGVLPALQPGWSAVVCTPSDNPFAALAQALAVRLAGDIEAASLLARADDAALILLMRRWRHRHEQALLIVDQAEELFTLNGHVVQERFTAVLGRLVLDADVHVILALRDDFLIQCQAFEALRPVFSDLTVLAPPVGEALRRALVQPALLSGYRFEDERLLDDMVRDVAGERGALPLLAFAMRRMWEQRDRERGLLTRRAYEELGGVAGALAQHAETTLEVIGAAHLSIVRELFRNLVTAEGTRALQGWDEVLSAFSDQRRETEEVLSRLVEARLLTVFEAAPDEGGAEHRRLEIIHESLLTVWPRLVRWRQEDAEGARLRDQLRQAAHLWDERGRQADLLWTGSSFAQYVAWKARYTGRLTVLERAFGKAMEVQAGRQRFRIRLGIAAAFASLLIVLAVVIQLWIQSRASEQRAIEQARRAEAQQLLALGQLEEEKNPSVGFAYALAALERTDAREIRQFALRQLWKGPIAFVTSDQTNQIIASLVFSSDGEWLADSGRPPRLWRRDASAPLPIGEAFAGNITTHFTSDGRKLVISGRGVSGAPAIDVLALPELTPIERIVGEVLLAVRGDRLISLMPLGTPLKPGVQIVVRSSPGEPPQKLGLLFGLVRRLAIDASGDGYLVSYPGKQEVLASTLAAGTAGQRGLFRTGAPVANFWLSRNGERVAILDDAGELHVASFSQGRDTRRLGGAPLRRQGRVNDLTFAPDGRGVVAAVEQQGLQMWDLTGPPDAEPIALGRGATVTATLSAAFEPSGRWLATEDLGGVTFWPATGRWPSVLRVSVDQPRDVAFDPNGQWIAASCRTGGVEVWPLTGNALKHRRLVEGVQVGALAVSPDGQFLATGTTSGSVLVLPLSGSEPVEFRGFQGAVWTVAFDATGRRIAAAGGVRGQKGEVVRIFDRQNGSVNALDVGDEKIGSVSFLPDGGVLVASFAGLRRFDPESGTSEHLLAQPGAAFLAPDGRHVLLLQSRNAGFPEGTASVYDLEQRRGWPLATHGDQVTLMAWDPSGTRIVTGSRDGIVRVGPVSGEEPHLLIGHQGPIWGVRVDATGRRVASASEDGTVRIWPMPDGQPLHTLPRDAFLEKLSSLTNVRVVQDASTSTGYRATFLPFQGWDRDPPTW